MLGSAHAEALRYSAARLFSKYFNLFSKAFDSVPHAAVLNKYSHLNIPDNIYNWVVSFFQDHSHNTRFGNQVSALTAISASIIQGSVIGPISYVITASDLQPVSQRNFILKYADDTY